MKFKTGVSIALFSVLTFGVLTYTLVDVVVEPPATRAPASVPSNYETMSASEKQSVLWDQITKSKYEKLPDLRPFGLFQLMALGKQEISIKGSHKSDFAPDGWRKYLHGRGAIAKIKIVPVGNHGYTGIFQGADFGLLRLSLTYQTTSNRPVAPGLALKVLRNNVYSANVSALVSLDGQGKEFNFFKFPMSNIVPIGKDMGQKMVHRIFSNVTHYPEELLAKDLASFDQDGKHLADITAPRQIFFVPGDSLHFASDKHDVREDFLKIPAGTLVYHILLAPAKYDIFDYREYTPDQTAGLLKDSVHVADIISTSEFVASEFGDDGIFFRHQLRP